MKLSKFLVRRWADLGGVLALTISAMACGCASSYATPGRAADLRALGVNRDQLSDGTVVQAMDRRPLAQLPTSIAIVRVQEPGYHSDTAESWGSGAYSVVTSRDIEDLDKKIAQLGNLPMVSGIAPLNRLLLPREFHSDIELRQAAGALHADMLLIYTLDTTFIVEDAIAPLTVLTLGLSPNQVAHVSCTASAVLMDTRNGYIYGIAEATEKQNQLASGWTNAAAVDQTRRRCESVAFDKLAKNLEGTWMGVLKNFQTVQPAAAIVPR